MNQPWRVARLNDENVNVLPQVWDESKGMWELLTEESLAAHLQKQLIAEQRENARLLAQAEKYRANVAAVRDSLNAAIALSPYDWSAHRRLAWVYGIVCGWGEATREICNKFRWDQETAARMERLHGILNPQSNDEEESK